MSDYRIEPHIESTTQPYWSSQGATLYLGDVHTCLQRLPMRSVHCILTSPPYWKLRSYNNGADVKYLELGAERTPEEYITTICGVFSEVDRVLRDDGTVWLNLGDTFDDGQSMIPAQVALALRVDGWRLIQDIIWYSPNKMPESATNRCTKSHEHIFLLSKGKDYYFDSIAIQEPAKSDDNTCVNKRDVWVVPTQGYPGAHTATFSPQLITPCILASTSEAGCCSVCQTPLERIVTKTDGVVGNKSVDNRDRSFDWSRNGKPGTNSTLDGTPAKRETVGWRKMCNCKDASIVPCTVLDPFVGSGTTVATAIELSRHGIGIDLSEDYLRDCAIPRVEAALQSAMYSDEPHPTRATNKRNRKSAPIVMSEDDFPPPPIRLHID